MRRVDPFGRRAMLLSVGMHAAIFGLGWLSTLNRAPAFEFIAYEIDLVSPPPALQADEPEEAREELVIERPEPEPAPPEPEVEEVVPIQEPEAEPPPEPEPQPEPDPPPEPEEDEKPVAAATTEEPEEPLEESGEGLNVRLEGLRRDYPEYYNNIIRQIQRCFRWRAGGGWETAVVFTVGRDGRATDIEFLTRSGSTAFDFEAMGAVDCAGQGRFGALPEDYPFEGVRVSFTFSPPR